MELRFRISAAQCQSLADRMMATRIARLANRRAAMQMRMESVMQRWLPPVFLIVPLLVVGLIRLDGASHRSPIEAVLPFVVAALIYGGLWWRFHKPGIAHLLRARRGFTAKIERRTQPLIAAIIERSVRRSVARLEGLHVWTLTSAALSVRGPSGRTAVIPWRKVERLHDLGDFYQVFTSTSRRLGLAYYLAKSTAEMDGDTYVHGLRQLGDHVPNQTGPV